MNDDESTKDEARDEHTHTPPTSINKAEIKRKKKCVRDIPGSGGDVPAATARQTNVQLVPTFPNYVSPTEPRLSQ